MQKSDGSPPTRYTPFGNLRSGTGFAPFTDRDFTGQRENRELGLLYYQARYYLPGIGRFASADTLVPDPANPQSLNRYTYSLNSPLRFVDPTGYRSCSTADGEHDFETCDQNLGAGADYGNTNLFNDAFPYFFLKYLLLAETIDQSQLSAGESLFDALIRFAGTDATTYITNAFSGQALAGGMAEILGSGYRQARPSDFLGQNVIWVIAAGSLSDAQRMENLGTLLAELTPMGIPCSFTADTLVLTEDGLVPIAEIGQHEFAWAYDEETEEFGFYPIVAVWTHEDQVILYLTINGETIATTPNHPFFTDDGEWVHAGDLQVGDEIRNSTWQTGTVESLVFTPGSQTMYNFTVAIAHTYFVGQGQWLVHNSRCRLFEDSGIPTADHFADRLENWGISERQALRAYQSGTRFTDSEGKWLIWDPKTKIGLRVDQGNLAPYTVFHQSNPSRSWTHGWFDPGW